MRFGNGDLLGRTNGHEFNEKADWDRSYGVVPSRHIGSVTTIRGLRPRLPSLRSVVPSRHALSLYLFAKESQAALTQNFTPKNYTYPSLEGITG